MTTTNGAWLYQRSEPDLFTVGFYEPNDGRWIPETDHDSRAAAAARVHYLNGGGLAPVPTVEPRSVEADQTAVALLTSAMDGSSEAIDVAIDLLPLEVTTSAPFRSLYALAGTVLRLAEEAGVPVKEILGSWSLQRGGSVSD